MGKEKIKEYLNNKIGFETIMVKNEINSDKELKMCQSILEYIEQLEKTSIPREKVEEKIKDINEEFSKNSKDNDSYYFDYSNEYAHIEEVLKQLLEGK